MDELKVNFQMVYFHQRNAMGVAMNMLYFGYREFVTTKKVEKIDILKKLCEQHNPLTPPDFNLISEFVYENLMDSVKISICFENFLKGLLLANKYIIHKLDKNIFPELYKEQLQRPISVEEIRKIKDWEINSDIPTDIESFKNQIKGITKFTLGMREILAPEYIKLLQIDPEIIQICDKYFQYRNNLHYYTGTSYSFGKSDYDELIKIIDFLNNHLVRIQNILCIKLGKSQEYMLPKILKSKTNNV